MDDEALRTLIREIIGRVAPGQQTGAEIPIEMSARHVHLTREAVDQLFGKGAVLGIRKELSQPGEFLSDRRVKLITPKGEIANVAVLGPVRKAVQVELSATDARTLGLTAPVNLSGNLSGAADVTILGECGVLYAPGSVIVAKAHVHLTEDGAAAYGVRDGEHVRIRIASSRPVTLDDVIVRVKKTFSTMVHIDTDESNACGGLGGAKAYLIRSEACAAETDHPSPVQGGMGFLPIQPGAPAFVPPARAVSDGSGEGITWAEGKLLNEESARKLCAEIRTDTVRLRKGTIVTDAAKDVFNGSRITIRFI